jgi:hypothetical protein
MNSIVGCTAQDERGPKAKGVLVWAIGQVDVEPGIKGEEGNGMGRRNDGYCTGSATAIVASTVLVAVLITETRFSFET